jgi:hypothetical protein
MSNPWWTQRRREAAAWLWLALASLLTTAPVSLCGRTLYYGDITVQFVPWRAFARQQLLAGHVPLWLPGLFAGMPFVGNCQSAVFYPFHWLTLPLDPARTIAAGYVLHLFLGCAGGYLWGRAAGRSRLAAVCGGLVYGLSGYVIAKQQFPSLAYTIAWLPWLFWAGERLWTNPGAPAMTVLAAICGLQWLSGHAQMSFMQLTLLAAYLAFRPGVGPAWRRWAWAVGGVALGTMLGAVQILPTLDLLRHSPRAAYTYHDVARFYLAPWMLPMSLWPRLFGAPECAKMPWIAPGPYWEMTWYVGLVSWPLALPMMRRRPFWAMVAVLGLILAVGPWTRVYGWLFAVCPPVRMFRDPARFSLYAVVALSPLVAAGLDAECHESARRWALALAGLVSLALTAVVLAPDRAVHAWMTVVLNPTNVVSDANRLALMWRLHLTKGLLGVLVYLAAIVALLRLPRPARRLALAVLLTVDLIGHGLPLNPTTSPAAFRDDVRPAALRATDQPLYAVCAGDSPYIRYGNYAYVPPEADVTAMRATAAPDVTLDTPTRFINGYDPLPPGDVHRFVESLPDEPEARARRLAPLGVAGEWDYGAGTLTLYPGAAPSQRDERGARCDGGPLTPQRWELRPRPGARRVDLVLTNLPGWQVSGGHRVASPAPLVSAFELDGTASELRLWYAPSAYRLGLFASLLALGLLSALVVSARAVSALAVSAPAVQGLFTSR